MALKNFVRSTVTHHGQVTWILTTLGGDPVEAFDTFCRKSIDYPYTTRKRYAEVVGRFLDYLHEAGAFVPSGISGRRLNDIVDSYPLLLRDGSQGLIKRIESRGATEEDGWLLDAARALSWKRLKPKSFSTIIS